VILDKYWDGIGLRPITALTIFFVASGLLLGGPVVVLAWLFSDLETSQELQIAGGGDGESLYLENVYLASLSGRHVTVITNAPRGGMDRDSTSEYIFPGAERILYRFHADTLDVYVRKASPVPSDLSTSVVIRQTAMNNIEMGDLSRSRDSLGVRVFPKDKGYY